MGLYRLMCSGSTLGTFFQVLPVVCFIGIVYAALRLHVLCKKQTPIEWKSEIIRFLFTCYLAGLTSLVLVPNHLWLSIWSFIFRGHSSCMVDPMFQFSYNLVPSVWKVLRGELILGNWVKTMMLLNTLMFVPMGIFLPLVFPRVPIHRFLLVAAVIPLAIELLQPVAGRSFDADDLLCNFFGILLGLLLTAVGKAFLEKRCR